MNKNLFLFFFLINGFYLLQADGVQPDGLAGAYPATMDNFGVIGSMAYGSFSKDDLEALKQLFDAFNISFSWAEHNVVVFPDKTNDYLKSHKTKSLSVPKNVSAKDYLTLGNALKVAGVLGILYVLVKIAKPHVSILDSYTLEKYIAGN